LDLVNIVETFMDAQQSINSTLVSHTHWDPISFMTGPTMLPEMISILWDHINILVRAEMLVDPHKTNCNNYEMDHLEPSSAWWIGSRFNYTN